MIRIEGNSKPKKLTSNNTKKIVEVSAKAASSENTIAKIIHQKSQDRSILSKTSKGGFRDNDTSNCDYVSDVFREQLSELEYSKVLGDSELRDQNTLNFGINENTFLSADNFGPQPEFDMRLGNNAKLKQIIFSPPVSSNGSSPPDGVGRFYNNNTSSRGKILHQSKLLILI